MLLPMIVDRLKNHFRFERKQFQHLQKKYCTHISKEQGCTWKGSRREQQTAMLMFSGTEIYLLGKKWQRNLNTHTVKRYENR